MGDGRAETYRTYAETCFRIAQTITDEAEHARWIDMARHWLHWAQKAEAPPQANETEGS
jgi:hypothetical protein